MKLCDPTERILVSMHPAWINSIMWFILVLLISVVLMVLGVGPYVSLQVYLGLTFLFGLNAIYEHYRAYYVITNKRIIVRRGLISTKQNEVWLSDARGLSMQESFWQKIISTGDIMVGTAATSGTEIVIRGVKNPQAVVDIINRSRHNSNSVTPSVQQPTSSHSKTDQVVYDSVSHQYVRK